ncbi:MAG TPA: hypothetical protein VFF63_00145 [Candidatus Babeliales bacterium]|nr:hypothetical protein [Candidatus Babeliales bacterium]
MKVQLTRQILCFAAALATAFGLAIGPARAAGTVVIAHPDGTTSTYTTVHIIVWNESLAVSSADGKGTVVFGKAACTKIGELVECLPYDATLFQNGQKTRIPLRSGTVWLNPTTTAQPLSHSSAQIPPRGVLLAVKTKRGTEVTLTGTVDEVKK